jgi:hypothetical protein
MRTSAIAIAVFALATSSALVTPNALAQANWDKSYNLSAKPSLQLELDDASVHAGSCGACRAVRIRVNWNGQDPSHWRVTEMQGGNGIHFELKHRDHNQSWFGGGWHGRSPEVVVDSPAETDLTVHTGDGSVTVAGLRGALDLKTGDGSIQTDGTAGTLRLHTGDGSVGVRRAEGTLNGSTGDGSMTIEGRFSQVEAHTGNGSVNVSLLPGSRLQSSSSVTTGDGSISLRVPRDLGADLQATTGDGHISNNLPFASGSGNDAHHVHGLINGGGPTLRLTSGDGSISMSAL